MFEMKLAKDEAKIVFVAAIVGMKGTGREHMLKRKGYKSALNKVMELGLFALTPDNA